MATVQLKRCDVFGTLNDVQSVRLLYSEKLSDGTYQTVRRIEVDMCPQAIARLLKFVERGTTPPSKKKADDNG